MISQSDNDARSPPPRRAALLRWIYVTISVGVAFWAFGFATAAPPSSLDSAFPVLVPAALLGLAVIVVRYRPPLEPWVYWLGAMIIYVVVRMVFRPAPFTSWEHTGPFLLTVLVGAPILLALRYAAIGGRTLCGACIALSVVIWLENSGVDLKLGMASFIDPERAQTQTGVWNRKFHETWLLVITWIALAALRPATRRDWFVAATAFSAAWLAIASGYSFTVKLVYAVSIGVFLLMLRAPRLVYWLSLAALVPFFLGAPVIARALWLWFTGNFRTVVDSGLFHFIDRFVRWEYSAELIAKHPWVGLGLGGSVRFPRMQVGEIFAGWELSPAMLSEIDRSMGRGGVTAHPHNLPLEVWADLGVFGIVFVTGSVASMIVNTAPLRKQDVGASARGTLLIVMLLVFYGNYGPWDSLSLSLMIFTAGLAAGTLTAGDRRSPAVALPGLTLRRERLLILAILLIASAVAVGNSARIHFADSRYVRERTVLDLERGVLRDRGKEIPLDGQAVGFIDWFGYIDRGARHNQDAILVSGWGYDPAATGETLQVLVFSGSELLGVTRTGRARPDLQRTSNLPNVDLLFTGFELRVPRPPEWWPPKTEVNAVYLGPSGSASLARVIDSARQRMEALPVGVSGFYVHVDETGNALVYARDECSEDDTAPFFFLHVVPVDEDALPDLRKKYSFDNLDFHFNNYGFKKDGRCFAMKPLPDYDIAEIRTGQFIVGQEGALWEEHFTFNR